MKLFFKCLSVVLLISFALACIFNKELKILLVNNNSQSALKKLDNLSSYQIKKNQTVSNNADYDFEKVESLGMNSVVYSTINKETPIGKISIPSVSLNLPIMNGISEEVLAIGAGTLKENQVMGEKNYALAGHHMRDPNSLFSPLYKMNIGDLVYITDMKYIYTYKMRSSETIPSTWLQVIHDHEDKQELTLLTCVDNGEKRLVVYCDFIEKNFYSSTSFP